MIKACNLPVMRSRARSSRRASLSAWPGEAGRLTRIFVECLWRSVKHEDVYLNGYSSMGELLIGLTKYFAFYNRQRPHQALDNQTPDEVYQSGVGGGALIVDKYPRVTRTACFATPGSLCGYPRDDGSGIQ